MANVKYCRHIAAHPTVIINWENLLAHQSFPFPQCRTNKGGDHFLACTRGKKTGHLSASNISFGFPLIGEIKVEPTTRTKNPAIDEKQKKKKNGPDNDAFTLRRSSGFEKSHLTNRQCGLHTYINIVALRLVSASRIDANGLIFPCLLLRSVHVH